MNWLAYDIALVLIGFAAIASIMWERYRESRPLEYVRIVPTLPEWTAQAEAER